LTISYEAAGFEAFFGVPPDFVDGSVNINGDDAIELFFDGEVIDVYGDVNVAGGDWKYMDGWSYRRDTTNPSTVFKKDDWMMSGTNAIDSCASNAACASAFPFHTYKHASLIITGVIDGPLSGGLPKAIELYATAHIPDLSIYSVGFANNGGGTDGIEFTFPSQSAWAGSFLTISYEAAGFEAFFGVPPDFVYGSVNINGDDAIELFFDGEVIDVYGDVNVAGGDWKYMDGWSYRRDTTNPSTVFKKDDWMISGINAIDSCASNAACESAFPFHTYNNLILSSTSSRSLKVIRQVSECDASSCSDQFFHFFFISNIFCSSYLCSSLADKILTKAISSVNKFISARKQPLDATFCAEGSLATPAGGV
jgi:hypothetical protein